MADAEARIVGKYCLYGKIGSGGMGTVYLARFFAPGGFRRIVAIKQLHPQFAENVGFVTAFLEEARLASRIHHPNVVAPLDVVAENGEVSLVFEHVLGVSLSVLLWRADEQGESVPLRVAASIMVNVLHGLQAAHEAKGDDGEALGLVHRDVSPQNVLVGRDGSARLLDFGIAKATGRSQITDEGVVKGKRGYMAPEHLVNATSQASDVYSAAVVLWEIVAARRLFPDDSSITERLAGNAAPIPSAFAKGSASEAETTLLAAVDSITTRGLAHSTQSRFSSANEMAIALEAVGVASPREVSAWVERIARDELGERRRLVELAESSNSMLPNPPSSTTSPTAESTLAQSFARPETPEKKSRRGLLGLLAVLVLLGAGALLVVVRHAPGAAMTSPPPALAVTQAAQGEGAPSAVNSAGSVISAADLAGDAGLAAAASAKAHASAAHPPQKRSGAPCKPYVIDKDGRTQFNEACLR